MIKIRNEKESDYKVVEDITRKAFYNLHVPGCGEHYLVHIMRGHEDFIPELDFVLELDGRVIDVYKRQPLFQISSSPCVFRYSGSYHSRLHSAQAADRVGQAACIFLQTDCTDCIFIRLSEPAGIYQCFYSHV